jgi:formiminotetrahydrofolate cyclodeaminase
MKLTDASLTKFSETLAASSPAPGGGSASALMGSLGAALTHMVAALTLGKEKYAEHEILMNEIQMKTEALRHAFIELVDKDTEAFLSLRDAFNMRQDSEEQKTARKTAVQEASKACTLTPLKMMRLSLEALELIGKMVNKSNESAVSDLGVAVLSLKTAIQGAWLNVLINLKGIHDEMFTKKHHDDGKAVLAKAIPLADQIHRSILESL